MMYHFIRSCSVLNSISESADIEKNVLTLFTQMISENAERLRPLMQREYSERMGLNTNCISHEDSIKQAVEDLRGIGIQISKLVHTESDSNKEESIIENGISKFLYKEGSSSSGPRAIDSEANLAVVSDSDSDTLDCSSLVVSNKSDRSLPYAENEENDTIFQLKKSTSTGMCNKNVLMTSEISSNPQSLLDSNDVMDQYITSSQVFGFAIYCDLVTAF